MNVITISTPTVILSGPSAWPGACLTGKKQSPINLNVTGNRVRRAEPFAFRRYGDVPATSFVSNKGKNVVFDIRNVSADDMPQVRINQNIYYS